MRSTGVKFHSGPTAETQCFSTHIVIRPMPNPTARKGPSGSASRQRGQPRFHQTSSPMMPGKATVEVLLSSAQKYSASASQ